LPGSWHSDWRERPSISTASALFAENPGRTKTESDARRVGGRDIPYLNMSEL
jgi:hypothetical protein